MVFWKQKVMRIMGSLITPFLILSLLLFLDRKLFQIDTEWYDWMSMVISVVVGFSFLLRDFQKKALLIGLVYFPVIYYLLFWYAFLFVGMVFGDWL